MQRFQLSNTYTTRTSVRCKIQKRQRRRGHKVKESGLYRDMTWCLGGWISNCTGMRGALSSRGHDSAQLINA